MNRDTIRPIPDEGRFSAFVKDNCIDVLCRSKDWYKVPPIRRYLYNLAASDIRLEDMRTECRVYTFDNFEALRLLCERSDGNEIEVALHAWFLWARQDMTFGVVHLDLSEECRGDLLLGDDPDDYHNFGDFEPTLVKFTVAVPKEAGHDRSNE